MTNTARLDMPDTPAVAFTGSTFSISENRLLPVRPINRLAGWGERGCPNLRRRRYNGDESTTRLAAYIQQSDGTRVEGGCRE
ncbi:MAG: hypothetical protein P8P40_15645 [Sulfitobacter sp.]|nr:hypothetical protein [Sulfitobacter sp.]